MAAVSAGSHSLHRRRKTTLRRTDSRTSSIARRARKRRREGFKEGYRQGVVNGTRHFGTIFEGTSIIIPTYNRRHLLKKCIASIERYTDLPYEIIVVDNASTDGTRAYLREVGGPIRYRLLETNLGFAGAVNAGLMMAKGRSIVLLSSDTIVTHRWLNHLLQCLDSDPNIGMVGPVTNSSSGDQQIDVSYRKEEEASAFAQKYNHSDPTLWRRIDRLAGFCLLFRRELFEAVGYFDEGLEIGNSEDDDYQIRVRLLGKSLVLAGDTFVQHDGSVSIKDVADPFRDRDDRNQSYYIGKWTDPFEWIHRVRRHPAAQAGPLPHTAVFYPENIAVQGSAGIVFWIAGGERRPVAGSLSFPAVRVSQIDLRRWPVGDPIAAGAAERLWRGLDDKAGWEASVALLPDGTMYHIEGETFRTIVSGAAMEAWHLHLKPARMVAPEALAERVIGLPIVPPPQLRQSL